MQLLNTPNRYGVVAIILHWTMALLLIFLLILGFYMTRLPISMQKLKYYGWHKEYGLLALWLVMLRIAWRVTNITPTLALPWWEMLAARAVHWAFYIFMFTLPLTGWLMTSAAGLPASFFGLFVLPTLVNPDTNALHLFEFIHRWLGYGLIGFILLHMSAALKHHFINKDDILRRML